VIATANPVGEGVDWIIERWSAWLDSTHHNPAKPAELRWFARVDGKEIEIEDGTPFEHDGETIEPRSRTFIPALPVDNPYLNKDYISTLQLFPEPLRSQLLYGLWNAGDLDDPYQVNKRAWVDAAMKRWDETNPFPSAPLALGFDVSYGGMDQTVLARFHKTWCDRLIARKGVEVPDGKTAAALALNEMTHGGRCMIDGWGWGAAAYESLRDAGVSVECFVSGAASDMMDRSGQLKFLNKRTEVHWRLREALDPIYGINLRLPPDDELKADLCSIRWEQKGDKIMIEPKEKARDRTGRSPDKADAVAFAWAMVEQDATGKSSVIHNREYNILDEV
jgi:hypothetical protein